MDDGVGFEQTQKPRMSDSLTIFFRVLLESFLLFIYLFIISSSLLSVF